MKIGIVTDTRFTIKSDTNGYTYRIYHLVEELCNRGHEVSLFASYDSETSARLLSVGEFRGASDVLYANIENAVRYSAELDILNIQLDHCGTLFDAYCKCPVVHNVVYGNHNQISRHILKDHKQLFYCAISESLTHIYPELNWQGIAYNGVELKDFPFNDSPDDYLLWLGRICPEKGLELAIEVAEMTGKKLFIGGFINDNAYFNREIAPRLSENIVHVGWLPFNEKIKYYKNATAFLFPTLHPEGFGNVMIESLACGTPVIALNNGAVPEVIKNDETGFVCENAREMAQAVSKAEKLNRHSCRKDVEARFSIEKMTDQYEQIFEHILEIDPRSKLFKNISD